MIPEGVVERLEGDGVRPEPTRAPLLAPPSPPRARSQQVQQPVHERPAPRRADDLRAEDEVAERAAVPPQLFPRPSSGNESTSVASSTPRWSRLSARLSSGGTEREPELAFLHPLGREHAPAARPPPARRPDAAAKVDLDGDRHRPRAGLLGVAVRLDDPLHELVPHHVLVRELDEADRRDRAQDVADLDQAGRLLARQVDLGDVARHDHLSRSRACVRNICICSGDVFCASSRMMNESFSVRPRMNASGATSTVPRSM